MNAKYRVVTYDSATEFEDALNNLEAGWGLHSWVQGQNKFVVAVYCQFLEVVTPGQASE